MRTFLVGLITRLRTRSGRVIAAALLACVIVRCAPYVAPIRAADLAAKMPAVDFIDRDGAPLGTLLSRDQEHTAFVRLGQVSPDFVQAIVAAEDGRFFAHGPVDAAAAARALWQLVRERRVVSGASTITMQLARMVAPGPSGVWGKAAEVWGAWRVAAGMDREQILEAYVNRLPMGGNVYGVEAAARTYFGVAAAKLDLAQSSLLAALPNDPNGLNPYGHLAALRARQRYVLDRMVADGYVSARQAAAAAAEEIALQPRRQGIAAGAHFLFYTARSLPPGTTRARTTLDRPLQEFVESQIRQTLAGLFAHDVHQAAALVVENRTGDVLAYAGSADYFDDAALGRNDGVQSLRQPGSTLKPFLYQYALENHVIRPNTILDDTPAYYAIPGGMLYSPADYADVYLGPVRVRAALADSLNVPAVRVLALAGVGNFLARLRELGFAHLDKPADFYGLGLTLGSGEVSLWDLTHAYLTAARAGSAIPLRVVLDDGVTAAPVAPAAGRQIGDPATWQLVTDMLADAHARAASFGVKSLLAPPFPAAVKTGTSSDYRDTWTVGYTTDYTVGVWVGNFDGRPMRRVSGVTGAAPLWNRIMLRLHERRDPEPFLAPSGLVRLPICATTGARPKAACPAIVMEYLYPQDLAAYDAHAGAPSARDPGAASYSSPTAGQGPPLQRLRIVFPHDGDAFVLHATDAALETGDSQALELQASAPPHATVRWRVNGKPIAAASGDGRRAIWPLRDGAWTIDASVDGATARVHVSVRRTVVQPLPTGFSTAPPSTI